MGEVEKSYPWLQEGEKRFDEYWPATEEALLGVIKDCRLADDVKETLKQIVEDLNNHSSKWDNYVDAIEGTIRRVVDFTQTLRENKDEELKKEAVATFETLRDGLWDLFKKVNTH